MVCKEYEILINQYIDNKLENEDSLRVSRHIKTCEGCREYYEMLTLMKSETEMLLQPPPDDLKDKIMERIFAEKRPKKKIFYPMPFTFIATVAAVIIFTLSSGNINNLFKYSKNKAENLAITENKTVSETQSNNLYYSNTSILADDIAENTQKENAGEATEKNIYEDNNKEKPSAESLLKPSTVSKQTKSVNTKNNESEKDTSNANMSVASDATEEMQNNRVAANITEPEIAGDFTEDSANETLIYQADISDSSGGEGSKEDRIQEDNLQTELPALKSPPEETLKSTGANDTLQNLGAVAFVKKLDNPNEDVIRSLENAQLIKEDDLYYYYLITDDELKTLEDTGAYIKDYEGIEGFVYEFDENAGCGLLIVSK